MLSWLGVTWLTFPLLAVGGRLMIWTIQLQQSQAAGAKTVPVVIANTEEPTFWAVFWVVAQPIALWVLPGSGLLLLGRHLQRKGRP